MVMQKEDINIVLFKKDLRLQDNEVINEAIENGLPILFLYIFERKSNTNFNYSERQLNFVEESLTNLNDILKLYATKILVVHSEVIKVLSILQQFWNIKKVFFHKDYDTQVGDKTYRQLSRFCKNNLILEIEIDHYHDLRTQFKEKEKNFNHYFNGPSSSFIPLKGSFVHLFVVLKLEQLFQTEDLSANRHIRISQGGVSCAMKKMGDINRLENTTSTNNNEPFYELSPFISWGNLTLRQLWKNQKKQGNKEIDFNFFIHSIRWHIHYVKNYTLDKPTNYFNPISTYSESKNLLNQKVWEQGMTGYPIIDAIMRCLSKTGCISHKMRMLVVSFYNCHLLLPWRNAVKYLSENLLDSSPGIHFDSFEIFTKRGVFKENRSFDLIKQSKDIDSKGIFIKKYVSELRNIPYEYIHEPHKARITIQRFHKTIIGKDYPEPITRVPVNAQFQCYNININF